MIHGGARFRPRRRTGENVYIIEETGAGRSCPAPVSLDFAAEKAVAGAEPEKRAVREEGQAGFRVALRAEFFSRPAYRRCGTRGRRESGRGASRAARKRAGAEGESGLPFEFDPLWRLPKRIAADRERGFNERTAEFARGGDVLKLLRARRCPTAGGLPPGATDG